MPIFTSPFRSLPRVSIQRSPSQVPRGRGKFQVKAAKAAKKFKSKARGSAKAPKDSEIFSDSEGCFVSLALRSGRFVRIRLPRATNRFRYDARKAP